MVSPDEKWRDRSTRTEPRKNNDLKGELMKKEEFVALGISDDLAEKAASASAEELKGFVPKSRFDEVNEEKKNLQTAKKKAEDDLEALKKTAGDNEALTKQITDLQTAAKQKDTEYAEQIKAMKLANAIRLGITDAQDADLVAGLVDQTKLILGDDGKLTGLDEQLKALRESKPFLFKQKEQNNNGKGAGFNVGSVKGGNAGGGVGGDGDKQLSMKEAIAAKLNAQNGGAGSAT